MASCARIRPATTSIQASSFSPQPFHIQILIDLCVNSFAVVVDKSVILCKFDKTCSNPACEYKHSRLYICCFVHHFLFERDEESDAMTSICPISHVPPAPDPATIPCKFGAACKNKECKYKHPGRL